MLGNVFYWVGDEKLTMRLVCNDLNFELRRILVLII